MAFNGVRVLDDAIKQLKPRYHFSAGGGNPPQFWEREPYVWDEEDGRVARFVSLGAFGGPPPEGKKPRWFYAFSLSPQTNTPPRPANATGNPFLVARPGKRQHDAAGGENYIFGNVRQPAKRSRVAQGEPGKPPQGYKCKICESTEHFINDCPERAKPPENYICKVCQQPGHFVRDCPTRNAVGDTGGKKPKPGYVCRACGSENHYLEDCLVANQSSQQGHERRGGKRGPPKEIAPDECWFCLSNPNLAKHLIVAIGTEVYLTLPKGQIIPTQSAASDHPVLVPGGGHVLIVPITHYPNYATIPPDLVSPIIDETQRYKAAVRAMFAKHGAVGVLFEIGRNSVKGGHAHVHIVPLPTKYKDQVEQAFIREGQQLGIDFELGEAADAAMESCEGGRGGYFKVELPDGRKMVHLMKDHVPFSLKFGRQVLVNLLGMPDRLEWVTYRLTDEEDTADAQEFKAAFAPFAPAD